MSVLSQPHRYTLDGILEEPCGNDGFTIADLERMRWREPTQLPKQWPPRHHGPRIRFWANDAEGNGLRMVEGTFRVGSITVKQLGDITEYEITGNLYPPIEMQLVPDEVDHDVMPVDEVQADMISSEIDFDGAGFKPLGFIDPDGLEIRKDTDYERGWGGRTFKTRQETTVEFNTWAVNHEVMRKLFER